MVTFWDPLVAAAAALQGQHVDTSAPDYVPPNLATTVSMPDGTQPLAGTPTRMVATVENRGSGSVLATVTLILDSAFSEPVVRAPASFTCKTTSVSAAGLGSWYTVTCKGGTVKQGEPVTVTLDMEAPKEPGTFTLGAKADMRLGFEDPDMSDNTAGVLATVR